MANTFKLNEKFKIKTGILASSSMQMATIGLGSAIPLMMKAYSDANQTIVQSVVTLPTLVSVPVSLIIGANADRIGKKRAILIGSIIALVAALIPVFVNVSLTQLLIASAFIGVGLGFIIPTSTGLITDFFEGPEQMDLMGKQSAFINMGGMLLSILGGIFALSNWHNTYLIFIYIIPIFILVLFFIPHDKKQKPHIDHGLNKKAKLSKEVFIMCAIIIVFGVSFGVVNTNNAILVMEKGLGTAATAGFAASMMTGIGIICGLLYGKIAGVLKNITLPVAILSSALGIFIIGSANSPAILYIGSILAGAGLSLTMPTSLFRVSQSVDQESATLSMSIFLACSSTSLFISPLIFNPVSVYFNNNSAQFRFLMASVCLITLTALAFFHVNNTKTKSIKSPVES